MTKYKIDYKGWRDEASPIKSDVKVTTSHARLVGFTLVSEKMKGVPKSKKHIESLSKPRVNKGNLGKSKSIAKIEACKKNAKLGGLTAAGAKATKEKYSKAIICYYFPSMKIKSEFTSIKEASRVLEINPGNISSVVNCKLKQTKGYYFEYKK